MKILVINSGSSSIKYRFYDMPKENMILKGLIEHIGEKNSEVKDHREGLKLLVKQISSVDAIGHRIVHGAEEFQKPTIITDSIIKRIKAYNHLAPLHNPPNISGILACREFFKGITQVGVFDTAFHQTLEAKVYTYGLPYEYYKKFKIRKYGFHGTSHEYVSQEAARLLRKPLNKTKLIVCHLGNGCSMSAVKYGKCIDTTMGFTPLEGLLMGTRCGDLDPALPLYLQKKMGISVEEMDNILNKQSGLKGVSGVSNDMRKIEERANRGDYRCRLAKDIFVYRIRKYIGSYSYILGGVDAVIFTAGIGENQSDIRKEVCRGLDFLKKAPKIMVVPTNEELMIARKVYNLIRRGVK